MLALADVVVHDRLSAAELLDLAPAAAERIDVGKSPGHARLTQEEITALLVERGKTGETVVRLKGGDPFVFARGGEEAEALAEAGVPYEVVPGITSALAVPAYAGIPVTLRYSSTSFTVVTGHEDPASGEGTVDWPAIAKVGGTIVILMGVGRWAKIAERLQAGGLAPDTPAAAVQWGTRPEQRTVRATLATLEQHELRSPSVIVVGRVAAEDLAWYERRPLFGTRIVVTRARAQASALVDRLRALGADTIELPAIAVEDPADGGDALRDALGRLDTYDWLVLTSPNGVHRTFAHVPDSRALGGVKVATIGTGTADALHALPDRRRPRARAVRGRVAPRRLPGPARRRAAGSSSPVPRSPATCCPTACGPRAGPSTSSRPIARRRSARPTTTSRPSPRPTPSRSRRRRRSRTSSTPSTIATCRRSSPASARSPRPPPASAA